MTAEIDGDSNPPADPKPDPRTKNPDGTWAFQGGVEQTPIPGTAPREDPNAPAPTRNAPATGDSAHHQTNSPTEKPSSGGPTDLGGSTKPLQEWKPGDTVFGQFRLIEKLGGGGMGEVWLVHKTGLERRSALKVIKPEIAQSEDGWRRFEREAQVMAKFNHPNVVTVFDYRRADPFAYIEMEQVHGRDLEKELKERDCRPSSLEWTAQILDQLCSVLQEAHGYIDETDGKPKPIIHRDIKPSNLMLVDKKPPGQNLKVLDFGIAKMIRDDMPVDGTIGFLGTVAYASPEQIRGMGRRSRQRFKNRWPE